MSGVWIRTGTVSISHGSHTVTGAGTAWLSGINKITAGSTFWLNNVAYEIARVNADTTLELVDIYDGTDISGAAYRIQICLTDSVPELALRIAAALSYWNAESTTYLTKSDNLASLADVAMGRRNLGVSASDAVSFRSVAVSDVNQTRANLGLDTGNDVSFKTIKVADPAATRINLGVGTGQDVAFQSLQLSGLLNTKGPAVFGDAVSIAKLATFSACAVIQGDNTSTPVITLNVGIDERSPAALARISATNTAANTWNYGPRFVSQILTRGNSQSSAYFDKDGGHFDFRFAENVGMWAGGQLIVGWAGSTYTWEFRNDGAFRSNGAIAASAEIQAHGTILGGAGERYSPAVLAKLDQDNYRIYWRVLHQPNVYMGAQLVIDQNESAMTYTFKKDGNINGPLGAATWAGSDQKLKKNIVLAAAGAMERIASIRLVEFDWNENINSGRHSRGMIAQELEQIDPLYVRKDPDMNDTENPVIYSVEQNAIVADLIAAVQEQQSRIKTLESSIASLTTSNVPSDTQ